MSAVALETRTLDQVLLHVCEHIPRVRCRAARWFEWAESDLWYELASCILGSHVSYESALMAARRLRSAGVLELPPIGSDLGAFERDVAAVLLGSQSLSPGAASGQRYRFPFLRANHLRRAAEAIYANGGSLRGLLNGEEDPRQARARLVGVACGIGPKQASLFLRNVGYTADLAILDRHVLQYMAVIGLLRSRTVAVRTIEEYECVESIFQAHAQVRGISVGDLDVAVWIVVRVIGKELNP